MHSGDLVPPISLRRSGSTRAAEHQTWRCGGAGATRSPRHTSYRPQRRPSLCGLALRSPGGGEAPPPPPLRPRRRARAPPPFAPLPAQTLDAPVALGPRRAPHPAEAKVTVAARFARPPQPVGQLGRRFSTLPASTPPPEPLCSAILRDAEIAPLTSLAPRLGAPRSQGQKWRLRSGASAPPTPRRGRRARAAACPPPPWAARPRLRRWAK